MRSRFTNEEVVAAYKQTGSVWKAAKLLGIGGQTVHERLRGLNYTLFSQNWTSEEIEELRALAPQCTLAEIARRLGRPYSGVAGKMSKLGLCGRFGNKQGKKIKRGSGFTKATTEKYFQDLFKWGGTVRQFCIQRGFDLEMFVHAAQAYQPVAWDEYVRTHSNLGLQKCPQCETDYIPMTKKQKTCSRKCSIALRVDREYFGGNRSSTIGLKEGICQLCEKEKPKLSSHHIFGKENDENNEYLVALDAGCHQLVSHLGNRADCTNPQFWENLIHLAISRKLGPANLRPVGLYVCVEIEKLTEQEVADDIEAAEELRDSA